MKMMQIHSPETSADDRPQEKGCYTVDELMDILCVGRKAIYSLIHKGFSCSSDRQRGLPYSQGRLSCLDESAEMTSFDLF